MVKNFWQNKKFLLGALGVAVLVLGFWIIQTQTTEAAVTEKEFIRVKLDSTSGTELWNFFADDNGQFDEFNVTGTSYTTNGVTYDCGLLLTEEFGMAGDDEDYIVWTKKGVILGKNGSIKDDVGTNYTSCCTHVLAGNSACKMDFGGFCNENVITNSNYVFQKSYGTLDSEQCDDNIGTPCTGTKSTCCALSSSSTAAEYKFKNQALCASTGKWAFADQPGNCASDGAYDYFSTSTVSGGGLWTKCTGSTPNCNAGVCVASSVEVCNNDVDDGDTEDTLADCADTDCPAGTTCGPDKKCDALKNCVASGGGGGGIIEFGSPSKFTELTDLVGSLVNSLSYLALALAVLMLVIAGFIFLTAGGDPKRVSTAKTLILYTIVALLIIILAKAIGSMIKYATR